MARYPLIPRVLVGLLALIVFLQGASIALALDADGFARAALGQWAVSGSFAGFLALVALAPGEVESLFPRRSALDLRRPSHYGALVAAAGALTVVLGVAGVVETLRILDSTGPRFETQTESDVLVGLAFNAVVLLAAPLVWIGALHPGKPVMRALGFRRENAVRAFGVGVAFSVLAILLVAAVLSVLTKAFDLEMPVNERALGIGLALTPLSALVVAIVSSVTEEVFFRGWLQPRIGVVGQALVFTVAHLNYVHVGETVAVLVLGLCFGLLFRATKNLWAPVGAHAAFNFLMLLALQAGA